MSPHLVSAIAPPLRRDLPRQDYFALYALCGVERYAEARDVAGRLGSSLFPPGPPRAIAAALVMNRSPVLPENAPLDFREEWLRLRDSMTQSNNPSTAEWAVDSVLKLAENRHLVLLSQCLTMAAEHVLVPRPLHRVRREVESAFDAAQGFDIVTSAALLKGGGR